MLPVSQVAARAANETFLTGFLRAVADGGTPPVLDGGADWDWVFALADRHKVLPLLFAAYGNSVPEPIRSKHAPRHAMLIEASSLQYAAAVRLSEKFGRAGLEFVLLKGLAYQETLYADLAVRPSFDIDFLVKDGEQARKAHGILLEAGFGPGQNWNQSAADYEKLEGFHLKYRGGHEYLEYYRKVGGLAEIVEIGVKVHSLSPAFTAHALRRRRPLRFRGAELPVCSDEDVFICMLENFFEDHGTPYALLFGSGRLRDYLDLRLFLERSGSTLDWSYVLDRLLDERIAYKAHFAAQRLEACFGSGFPEGAATAFGAAYRLSRMRTFQACSWAKPGTETRPWDYASLLGAVLREYQAVATGLSGRSRVRDRLEARAEVEGVAYDLALGSAGGRLFFEVGAAEEIPEDLVFSIERIVPGDESPFESVSLRRSGAEVFCHRSKGPSFHSMGRLARADKEGWVRAPGPTGRQLRADVTGFFAPGHPAPAPIPVHYSYSVHKHVVGDIYHHFFGDDLDFLFQSKFSLLASH